MDLVDGVSLSSYLKTRGTLKVEQAIPLFVQICFGLYYAHEKGVIHRDLKPGNIIWTPKSTPCREGEVKIVDFGIAKIVQSDEMQALTRTGDIIGSPLYMSPEQCRGSNIDSRSDIYSLGCVFYEMLTGVPPFIGDSALSTLIKHQNEKALSMKEGGLGADFPEALEIVIARMLEKEPADRYQTMAEVIDDLARQLDGQPVARPKSPAETRPRHTEGMQFSLLLLIAGTLLLFVMAAFLIHKFVLTPPPPTQRAESVDDFPAATNPIKAFPSFNQVILFSDRHAPPVMARCYHFPERSWGTIAIIGETRDFCQAKGDIVIPGSFPLEWKGANGMMSDPATYSNLKGDEFFKISIFDARDITDRTIEGLSTLERLQSLSLIKTDITDRAIPSINKLTQLVELDITETEITAAGIKGLKRLKEFASFSFGSNSIELPEEVFSLLSGSKNLISLSMRHGRVNDDDLAALSELRALRHLNITPFRSHVSDKTVARICELPDLEWLEFRGGDVTALAIPYFARMKRLNQVKLFLPRFSESDVDKLRKSLPPKCRGVIFAKGVAHPLS